MKKNIVAIQKNTIDKTAWESLNAYLKPIGRREIYGIGIGTRQKDNVAHHAFVFPKQVHESPTLCGIDWGDLAILVQALSKLNESLPPRNRLQIVSWTHTHPHLTVFLSELDKRTLEKWKCWDAATLAVVVDPYDLTTPIKTFRTKDKETKTAVSNLRHSKTNRLFYKLLLQELQEILPDLEAMFTPFGEFIPAAEEIEIPSLPVPVEIEKDEVPKEWETLVQEQHLLLRDYQLKLEFLKYQLVSLHQKQVEALVHLKEQQEKLWEKQGVIVSGLQKSNPSQTPLEKEPEGLFQRLQFWKRKQA